MHYQCAAKTLNFLTASVVYSENACLPSHWIQYKISNQVVNDRPLLRAHIICLTFNQLMLRLYFVWFLFFMQQQKKRYSLN